MYVLSYQIIMKLFCICLYDRGYKNEYRSKAVIFDLITFNQ